MAPYLARRLGSLALVVFGVTVVVFVISRVVPGDVALLWTGQRGDSASAQTLRLIREQYHLDRPLAVQYLYYVRDLLQGDLGISVKSNRPVRAELAERLPNTIELGVAALLIGVPVGIALGVLSATRRNSLVDHSGRVVALVGVCMPVFWLGLLLQMLLYYRLGLLPSPGGRLSDVVDILAPVQKVTGFLLLDSVLTGNPTALWDALLHLAMPATTLAMPLVALISRMTRSSMLDVLSQDYIRTARAKGIGARGVHYRHALRNALLPVLTVVGLAFGTLLTGSVVTELIYYWPGVGQYAVQAILAYDGPVIMAFTAFAAITFAVANLGVDLLYALVDPQIRYS
ncbi:MAG: ABC transporter permease [Armatimonadota bacterium]|nr:ABC transporter permease [Armatimonadota bacterium]